MITTTEQPVVPGAGPGPSGARGSLLRAELRRLRSRRFLRVLLLLCVLGWLAGTAISFTQFGSPDDGDYAEARQEMERIVAEQEMFRQQCLEDPNLPSDLPPEELCGPPMTTADLRPEDFLSKRPFSFADTGLDGALAFAGAAAVATFLAGATWIGAEWSSRSIVALLFWAPRRTAVMRAKITALILATATFGVLTQIGWLTTAGMLSATVGDGRPLPEGFWGQLLATGSRGVLLTVLAGLFGFGLANLVRSTGAALGVGFVYVVVVENVLRVARPRWQPWLLTNNAVGLVRDGGTTLYIWPSPGDEDWTVSSEPVEYLLTAPPPLARLRRDPAEGPQAVGTSASRMAPRTPLT